MFTIYISQPNLVKSVWLEGNLKCKCPKIFTSTIINWTIEKKTQLCVFFWNDSNYSPKYTHKIAKTQNGCCSKNLKRFRTFKTNKLHITMETWKPQLDTLLLTKTSSQLLFLISSCNKNTIDLTQKPQLNIKLKWPQI
jgi:hypothetical protein